MVDYVLVKIVFIMVIEDGIFVFDSFVIVEEFVS